MEDTKWKQQAKRNWFMHGDCNTKYFHAWTNHRRRTNHIKKIKDAKGIQWAQQEDVDRAFVQHF
jgi:hypothetical protein